MCNCEKPILSSTATTAVNSGALLITPTVALSPDNEERVKILITTSTPSAGASLPAQILLNGENVLLLDKFGNIVYGNQLYENMVIKGYYGNNGYSNTPHFQLVKIPHRYYYY